MICTWPEGAVRPAIPLTYNSETMHGFEYQAAAHMIQMGMTEEAHNIVSSIRSKYDGHKRNPYNEFECGSNYARSMASYAILLAHSGFTYDMTQHTIGFAPSSPDFSTFWSIDGAWGTFTLSTSGKAVFKILSGELSLEKFSCSAFYDRDVSLSGRLLEKVSPTAVRLSVKLQENDELCFTVC